MDDDTVQVGDAFCDRHGTVFEIVRRNRYAIRWVAPNMREMAALESVPGRDLVSPSTRRSDFNPQFSNMLIRPVTYLGRAENVEACRGR